MNKKPKLIVVNSLRNGLGRTTICCLIANELAELGYKTLVLDNNFKYCDISNYLLVETKYTIDDIRPFVAGKSLEQKTLIELTEKVSDNLYVLAGSKLDTYINVLTVDEVEHVKETSANLFDYIVIDSRAGIINDQNLFKSDIVDTFVVVTQPNKNGYLDYKKQTEGLNKENKQKLKTLLGNKSVIVINRYSDEIEFDDTHLLKSFGNDNVFKLHYSPSLVNFCNGYKCKLEDKCKNELNRLIERITKAQISKTKNNISFGKRLKSFFGVM